jgi:hypothetical protein
VLALGLAAFVASTAGLMLLVEPVPSWYYQLAWWSYILAADGLNRRLSGTSLIRDRPREFLWLAGLSVAWWCVFELINLRLGNWYYVMNHATEPARWASGIAAFATVLPGIVETLELAWNVGWLRSVRTRKVRWTGRGDAVCVGLGILFFALPLLWPERFFHLTWGSFALLLEPWNRRHARASFLRDLEAGEAGPLLRTLLAGLVCGLLWELWNYWARTKWVYTVPGFEDGKLFEMPLLGFMGFPPFAVECLVVVRFVQALGDRVAARGPRAARRARLLAAGAAAAFTGAVFAASDATVDSVYVPVAQMEVLPAAARQRLSALGLRSPERLLRALGDAASREEWSRRSGIPPAELEALRARVELVAYKGLGAERARQLARLGVSRRDDLARWAPPALAAALRAQGPGPPDRFLERRVRVWLRGLRS